MSNIPTVNSQPTFYWHLEVSSKCTLECPRCPRTEKPGMYTVTEHDLNFVKKVLTQDILSSTTGVLICGGQGDPIYCKELLDIISYIKKSNNKISIKLITNGSYKTVKWWETLSSILDNNDSVVFSVDGWNDESNNKYRVNSNFESIINGVKTLSKNKDINIIWSTIVFSFNEHQLEKIQNIAEDCGATYFQLVQSSLFGSNIKSYIDETLGYDPLEPTYKGKFFHSDRGLIIPLKPTAKKMSSERFRKNLQELYNNIKNDFDNSDLLPSCLLNERGLYVDAEGILYPCSWISHPFGERTNEKKTIKWKESLFVKHKDAFNLHNHNLNTILNSDEWNKLHSSFYNKDKHFIECSQKCSKKATLSRIKNYLSIKDFDKENSPDTNLEIYNKG